MKLLVAYVSRNLFRLPSSSLPFERVSLLAQAHIEKLRTDSRQLVYINNVFLLITFFLIIIYTYVR